MIDFPDILERLIGGVSLKRSEASQIMGYLMDGLLTPAQMAALLVAIRTMGTTVNQVTGFTEAMRERLTPVNLQSSGILDTCGTGASRIKVFNVSTAAAFVAASASIPVAKHGNRAISGKCGSADVLEALGVNINLKPEQLSLCFQKLSIVFLFATAHHPAMRNVGGVRKELGVPTIFNLLGPLSNPARAEYQIMGVYDKTLCELAVRVLLTLGSKQAVVVHGMDGLCEISSIGTTFVCEILGNKHTSYYLKREMLGLKGDPPSYADLAPEPTAELNAILLKKVLSGNVSNAREQACHELLLVNAAGALKAAGKAENWLEGVEMARNLIQSGAPVQLLENMIEYTQQLGNQI